METEQFEQFDDMDVKPTIVPDITRPNPQAGANEDLAWVVYTRSEREEVQGRSAAITLAKEWTADEALTVMVESVDGRVKMQFKSGSLVDYVLETRKGRKA
ncbi:MAG: hypothetical protein KC549_16395 [Myxococcales bacterium]|nr:hypothetical protein [Myxococcales bacterium]MCB9544429.1 hypothetical protein [Myxococcales bacterium]